MVDKNIPKDNLDRCIELTRTYYQSVDEGACRAMLGACKELEGAVRIGIYALNDVISGIVRPSGLKPDATNEDIYKVLEVLGWSVVSDEQAEH